MKTLLGLVTLSAAVVTGAQQHDHAAMSKGAAGGTTTLSAEQVKELLAGDGMGLAKPAELNHYPGPKHVLELATELALTADQLRRVEAIRADMLAAAKKLGAAIVEAERGLDAAFEKADIDARRLRDLTGAIARLQGELRAVHLAAHLTTRQVLTADQVTRYDALRGHAK